MARLSLIVIAAFAVLILFFPVSAWDYTTRVSVATGGAQAASWSMNPAISADGRYTAFDSNASDLVTGDTNNKQDVFVHDRITGVTTRVSVATGGAQATTDKSEYPSISADGRYIAFESNASDLVTGDTNNKQDVFVHDRITGVTTRVSVATGGTLANSSSWIPSISADGRYVAFYSSATNLVAGDTNGFPDVFVHDRNTGVTTRESVATGGTQATGGYSARQSISADGRYIAFDSDASNLVSGDTNGYADAFVHDRITGVTTRVSVATGGAQATSDKSEFPSISADGRYVAFESKASDLVTGDTNGFSDIFVHDRITGVTTRVSVATGGAQATQFSRDSSISADGRYVAFESFASDLVTGDTNGMNDVFVHDRTSGTTIRVSVGSGGTEGNSGSSLPSISADGQCIAYMSWATNLIPGDTNSNTDIFVRINAVRHNAVFRPSVYDNWIFTDNLNTVTYRDHYGLSTDKPLVGDFNNDGVTDRAVFRDGNWIVDYSMDGSVNSNTHFGMTTDIPLVGYFNGDRVTDRAVFRNGQWIVDLDMDGDVDSRTYYGMAGDIPLAGDFNIDGTPDRAVFRSGQWIIDLGMDGNVDFRNNYGMSTDFPLMGWIDGNTVMDRAVFRSGEWIMDYNMDGSVDWRPWFGMTNDRPLTWVKI